MSSFKKSHRHRKNIFQIDDGKAVFQTEDGKTG